MSWRDFGHGGPIVTQQHLTYERTHTGGAPLVLTIDTSYLRDTSELAKVVNWCLCQTQMGEGTSIFHISHVLMER